MNFAQAVDTRKVKTDNGMKAYAGTGNEVLNFFSSVGGRRGQGNTPLFSSALQDNTDLAIRALLWSRDVRGGAGERQTFRDCLNYLAKKDLELCKAVIKKTPEVGRWDDLLCLFGTVAEAHALEQIAQGIKSQNGLCAKWMPRKGAHAEKIRNYLGYSPKQYRKTLVTLTQVVEQKMCAKQFDQIELKHVPSLASIRYRNAFTKHIPQKVAQFAKQVETGEVKVNASAVYPHQITKQLLGCFTQNEQVILEGQWNNLPNYVPEDSSALAIVDVSGSMNCPAGGNSSVTCRDVAVGLGLYLASKNTGAFKDLFLTFSATPEFIKAKGTLKNKVDQTYRAPWGYNTNLEAAFMQILKVAKDGNVSEKDMPKTLIIFSDMQFDAANNGAHGSKVYNPTARKLVKMLYKEAGYEVPNIVFWNLNDRENKAARADDVGAALVSGFSPSLIKPILAGDFDYFNKFTPMNLMKEVLNSDRYNWQ